MYAAVVIATVDKIFLGLKELSHENELGREVFLLGSVGRVDFVCILCHVLIQPKPKSDS
jgi:hypothetical protein